MEILTVKQAAELLQISRQTLYEEVRQGLWPHFRVGRKKTGIRFHRETLLEAAARRAQGNLAPATQPWTSL